jgi:hypothetical protein
MEEGKRRTKEVEVFCGPGSAVRLPYLLLVKLNGWLLARRLKEFAEIQ